MQGTIKKLTDRGFGFIETDGDADLFFHASSLHGRLSFQELHEGQEIEFEVADGPKGQRAVNIRLI